MCSSIQSTGAEQQQQQKITVLQGQDRRQLTGGWLVRGSLGKNCLRLVVKFACQTLKGPISQV